MTTSTVLTPQNTVLYAGLESPQPITESPELITETSIFRVGLSSPSAPGSAGGSGSGLWMTIADKEQKLIAFFLPQSQMLNYFEHSIWKGSPSNSPRFPCIGRANGCPGCAIGHKARWRAITSVLVVDPTGDDHKVQIYSFGPMIKDQVLSMTGVVGEDNFPGSVVALSRSGMGLKTRYNLTLANRNIDLGPYEQHEVEAFVNPKTKEGIMAMLNEMRIELDSGETKDDDDLAAIKAITE